MEISELEPFFPFPVMRDSQRTALEKFVTTTNKGRKFTALELPTGVGKTAIAVTLSRWAQDQKAYILTIQKMLQEQYMHDFPDLVTLKGAGNYRCGDYPEMSCEEGPAIAKIHGKRGCDCSCPYKAAKSDFISAPIGVTNFAYFCSCIAEQRGLFKPRKLLIIDEAHNTESVLINQAQVGLTKHRLGDLRLMLPHPVIRGNDLPRAKQWLETAAKPAIEARQALLEQEIDVAYKEQPARLSYLLGVSSGLTQLKAQLDLFINSDSHMWFVSQQADSFEVKPMTGKLFAEHKLFSMADQVVFLSATILDPRTFIRNLGLSPSQCGYLSLPSEFPRRNRLVTFSPAGSMSFKNYDETLPKLLRKIERILAKHPEDKGIIHCQSYKTMNHILEYFKSTPYASRLVGHASGHDKQAAIQQHIDSAEPTVLLSPSMTEGLDLREDLSRFQVVAKMPFASLGDPYIKARMELDPSWYRWQTALTLVQSLGRSIRSSEDYAASYIIDSDFARFLRDASGILPEWWVDSIEM